MTDEATLMVPEAELLSAGTDAVVARRWVGTGPVDAALALVTPERRLGQILLEQGVVTPSQATQLAQLSPVRLIGGFEIMRQLGAGAMGEVWLARRVGDGQEVALKTINDRYAGNQDFIQRFERESDVIAGLHHVHIAGAVARGQHLGLPWLAMEFVHGPTLQDLQKGGGALPEGDVLRIAVQVAKALDHAWTSASLIHRDIKPGNILIDRSGRAAGDARPLALEDVAKVIDFGLAKSVTHEEGHVTMTMTGMVMGTPSYMPPEQIHGAKDLDHRTDQYALGATLYHLLTGRTPFDGNSSAAVITQHLNAAVPDPGALVPSLRSGTRDLVRTCLAKRPDDRFNSWTAFIHAVEGILRELGTEPPTTIRLLRKPMVLPKKTIRTPLPGSLGQGPDLAPQTKPITRPTSESFVKPPVPRPPSAVSTHAGRPATGSVRRTPLPAPTHSGEQALAQAMTSRVQNIRRAHATPAPAPPAASFPPPGGSPVDSHHAGRMSAFHAEAVGDEPEGRDFRIVRNLVLMALVAGVLVALIVLVP